VLSTLKLILAHMQVSGYVAQNVATPARIKLSGPDKKKLQVGVDVPSKAEVAAMLHQAGGRARTRFVIAALAGLRASETRALLWEDVDFAKRVVHVRSAADWWGTIGPVKSENGYRDVPMTPLLINTLRERRLTCPPSAPGALDLVFPGRDGKVAAHSTMQTDFDAVQRLAGVVVAGAGRSAQPKYSLHALRHFFASWGIEQGFPPKRLQELLGHGSIQMTYDRYGHWLGDIADDHARLAKGEAGLFGLHPIS
jgi:integrase